jgi:hypothetical protein
MNRAEIKQEIIEYLKGPKKDYVICHLRGSFTLITDKRFYNVSKEAAETFLNSHPETDLIHFSLLNRKWDYEQQEFTGPLDKKPEIFKGREVRTIEIDKPPTAESIISHLATGKPFSLQTKEVIEENNHCISPGIFSVFY